MFILSIIWNWFILLSWDRDERDDFGALSWDRDERADFAGASSETTLGILLQFSSRTRKDFAGFRGRAFFGNISVFEEFRRGPEDIIRAMAFLRGALRKHLEVN